MRVPHTWVMYDCGYLMYVHQASAAIHDTHLADWGIS